jgi:hypothetical protein
MSTRVLTTIRKAVTTAGTRVALSSTAKYVKKLKIKALPGNTGVMYLGDVAVSASNGYPLAAGAEISLVDLFWKDGDVVDLSVLYIDSAVNGEGVSLVYVL